MKHKIPFQIEKTGEFDFGFLLVGWMAVGLDLGIDWEDWINFSIENKQGDEVKIVVGWTTYYLVWEE